jgi:hypothetical protein
VEELGSNNATSGSGALAPLSGSLLNILASISGAPSAPQQPTTPGLATIAEATPKQTPEPVVQSPPQPQRGPPVAASDAAAPAPPRDSPKVPALALAPIVAAQPSVAMKHTAALHAELEDPGLYELSGVTLDSKQNKVPFSAVSHLPCTIGAHIVFVGFRSRWISTKWGRSSQPRACHCCRS